MGSQHKKKKKTQDVNVVIADIQDNLDQQTTKAAIQPAFEGITYQYQLRNSIDFVNVTETTDPSQTGGSGGTAAPPVFTLSLALHAESTQINIAWNAVSWTPVVTSFKLYRATNPDFTGSLSGLMAGGAAAGSYGDPLLTPNTLYYYRMSSINSNGEGAFSETQSKTTASSNTS